MAKIMLFVRIWPVYNVIRDLHYCLDTDDRVSRLCEM